MQHVEIQIIKAYDRKVMPWAEQDDYAQKSRKAPAFSGTLLGRVRSKHQHFKNRRKTTRNPTENRVESTKIESVIKSNDFFTDSGAIE